MTTDSQKIDRRYWRTNVRAWKNNEKVVSTSFRSRRPNTRRHVTSSRHIDSTRNFRYCLLPPLLFILTHACSPFVLYRTPPFYFAPHCANHRDLPITSNHLHLFWSVGEVSKRRTCPLSTKKCMVIPPMVIRIKLRKLYGDILHIEFFVSVSFFFFLFLWQARDWSDREIVTICSYWTKWTNTFDIIIRWDLISLNAKALFCPVIFFCFFYCLCLLKKNKYAWDTLPIDWC